MFVADLAMFGYILYTAHKFQNNYKGKTQFTNAPTQVPLHIRKGIGEDDMGRSNQTPNSAK